MKRRLSAALAALMIAGTVAVALSGCGNNIPAPTNVPQNTAEQIVYFSTGRSLLGERRLVDSNNVYVSTLTELLKGEPKEDKNVAIVQPQAKVLSVTVDKDGVATIDWSKDVLKFDATDKEKRLAWASIMMTLGQFPEIKKVRFTVEGKDSGTVDGNDIQKFWGFVTLKGQPWKSVRPPGFEDPSKATSGSAESSKSTESSAKP